MKWFRLYTEIKHDPKLRRLPASYRWVWVTILCMARESPKPGWLLLRKDMPAQPEDIADEANVPREDATRAIELFKGCSYEMLTEEGGVLRVINWGKRQYENDSSAARTRRYRERQNQHKLDGRVPQGRSDGSCDVTGDAAKLSRSSAYSPPQSDCGKVCGNGGEIDRNPIFPTLYEDALFNEGFQTCSSGMRHHDNHSDVMRDGGCDVTGNVTGDVTLQSYRNTVTFLLQCFAKNGLLRSINPHEI